MNNVSKLRGILGMKYVAMEQSAFEKFSSLVSYNIANHVSVSELDYEKAADHRLLRLHRDGTMEEFALVDGSPVMWNDEGEQVSASAAVEDDRHVLHITLTGPVTRQGGWCSYGSQEIRDLLIKYADDESCVGMILDTCTHGGDAYAIYDMQQGMQAWKEAGKRSIQFIDGYSYSAGVALGVQCDRIIAMNTHCGVGCIGAMYANVMPVPNTVSEDGTHRFVYVVARQSPDKNLVYRQAAAGDTKQLEKEVSDICQDFLDTVTANRPSVPADMMTGKDYLAGDCIGTLIDGIGDFGCALSYALDGEENWDTASSSEPTPTVPSTDPEEDPDNQPEPCNEPDATASATVPVSSAAGSSTTQSPSSAGVPTPTAVNSPETIQTTNMNINHICAAIGLQETELQVDEQNDGIFMNAALIDTINEKLGTLTEQAEAYATEKADMEKAHADKVAGLEGQIAEMQGQIDELGKNVEEANAKVATAEESVKALTEEKAEMEKAHADKVAELEKEITELSEKPGDSNLPKNPGAPAASAAAVEKSFEEMSLDEMSAEWYK